MKLFLFIYLNILFIISDLFQTTSQKTLSSSTLINELLSYNYSSLYAPTSNLYEKTSMFHAFPKLVSKLHRQFQTFTFENSCFKSTTITLLKIDQNKIKLSISPYNKKSSICFDYYYFSTTTHNQIKLIYSEQDQNFTISNLSENDITEIKINGLRIFSFPSSFPETFTSFIKIFEMYSKKYRKLSYYKNVNEKIPPNELNEIKGKQFLEQYANFIIEDRENLTNVTIDIENYIQSGDIICIADITFLQLTSQYWNGGICSHSGMALRHDNGTVIIYEMDLYGAEATEYNDYLTYIKPHATLIHFPLKQKYRNKVEQHKNEIINLFNKIEKEVTWEWYNFLFVQIDSTNMNFPDEIAPELFLEMFKFMENNYTNLFRYSIQQGLNNRMNTINKTLSQLVQIASQKGITFEEMMALPEINEYKYNDNKTYYICSSMIAEFYKLAGLFDGIKVRVNELNIDNLLSLSIFDNKFKRPDACEKADPGLNFCIIRGRFRYYLNNKRINYYGSIKPYDHMFETCDIKPPYYIYTPGC